MWSKKGLILVCFTFMIFSLVALEYFAQSWLIWTVAGYLWGCYVGVWVYVNQKEDYVVMKDNALRAEVMKFKQEFDEFKREVRKALDGTVALRNMAVTRICKLEDFLGVDYVYIPEKNASYEYRKSKTDGEE